MRVWDWHYRVYFSMDLRNDVVSWSKCLTADEQLILNETLDFYTSFYSFGILFDLIEEDPASCSRLLDIAEQHPNDIIATPQLLADHYRQKIRAMSLGPALSERLHALLTASLDGRDIRAAYRDYIAKLFGHSFERMQKAFMDDRFYSYAAVPPQKKIRTELLEHFDQINQRLLSDQRLTARYGFSKIQDSSIRIEEGTSYGEWWDRELTDNDTDVLILYKSNSAVNDMDYLYTIIHEAYPGHGHFYNSTRSPDHPLDHGAMALTEGWATYCEWNTYPSDYVDAIRHNYMVLLHNTHCCTASEVAQIMWDHKRSQNISFQNAVPSIIYATQYVGYLQSYYLGALWLELAIGTDRYPTPEAFLTTIRNKNKGEFFRLWL